MYTAKQFWSRHGPIIIDASLSQLQSLLQGDLTIGQNSAISSWESPSHGWHQVLASAYGMGFLVPWEPWFQPSTVRDTHKHLSRGPLTPARLARCVPDEMKWDQPCRVVACSCAFPAPWGCIQHYERPSIIGAQNLPAHGKTCHPQHSRAVCKDGTKRLGTDCQMPKESKTEILNLSPLILGSCLLGEAGLLSKALSLVSLVSHQPLCQALGCWK